VSEKAARREKITNRRPLSSIALALYLVSERRQSPKNPPLYPVVEQRFKRGVFDVIKKNVAQHQRG
jgi:hypothetical protein